MGIISGQLMARNMTVIVTASGGTATATGGEATAVDGTVNQTGRSLQTYFEDFFKKLQNFFKMSFYYSMDHV